MLRVRLLLAHHGRLGGCLRFGAQQPVDLQPEQPGRGVEIKADFYPVGMAVFFRLHGLQDLFVLRERNAKLVADPVADGLVTGQEIPHV